ncbi:hypothetical protein Droror1_Dr00024157 [Drosera rotundifolia]
MGVSEATKFGGRERRGRGGGGGCVQRERGRRWRRRGWRRLKRRIRAEIKVNANVESVWNVLTDYERLADFIPNLVYSGRILCPYPERWFAQALMRVNVAGLDQRSSRDGNGRGGCDGGDGRGRG